MRSTLFAFKPWYKLLANILYLNFVLSVVVEVLNPSYYNHVGTSWAYLFYFGVGSLLGRETQNEGALQEGNFDIQQDNG